MNLLKMRDHCWNYYYLRCIYGFLHFWKKGFEYLRVGYYWILFILIEYDLNFLLILNYSLGKLRVFE